MNNILTDKDSASQDETRFSRQTVTPPRSRLPVLFKFKAAGLQIIEPKPLTQIRKQVAAAWCVSHNLPWTSFQFSVPSFSNKLLHLPKEMVFAHAAESLALWAQPKRPCGPMNGESGSMPFISRVRANSSWSGITKPSRNWGKKTWPKFAQGSEDSVLLRWVQRRVYWNRVRL